MNLFGLVSLLYLAFSIWALTVEIGDTVLLVWLWGEYISPASLYTWRFIAEVALRYSTLAAEMVVSVWYCLERQWVRRSSRTLGSRN